jgi:hypothetical protein
MRGIKSIIISILAVGLLAGSAVVVTAQDEEATTEPNTPAIVTGTMLGGGEVVQEGTNTDVDGVNQQRGFITGGRQFEADDPRLTGTITFASSGDFRTVGDTGAILISNNQRIENDKGTWSGSCDLLVVMDGLPDPFACLFSGDGAYDGLSAYLVFENPEQPPFPFQGLIFEGEVPPVPEAPSAE